MAEKIYTKSFGTENTAPSTWFSFELDTLYLDWRYTVDDDDDDGDSNSDDGEPIEGVIFNFFPTDLGEDVNKVRNLALYNGTHPIDIPPGGLIDHVLSYFGNVRSLTMIAPKLEHDDGANLVFLDYSDVSSDPEYLTPPSDLEPAYHPASWEIYLDLEKESGRNYLWGSSESLWTGDPYSFVGNQSIRTDGGPLKWTKPHLQYKPIMTL